MRFYECDCLGQSSSPDFCWIKTNDPARLGSITHEEYPGELVYFRDLRPAEGLSVLIRDTERSENRKRWRVAKAFEVIVPDKAGERPNPSVRDCHERAISPSAKSGSGTCDAAEHSERDS